VKMYILLISFFVAFLNLNGQDSLMNPDFNATVIKELNEPFISAINRHLKTSKASKIKNAKDFYIILYVSSYINEWQIPKIVYDSIYGFNDFSTIPSKDSLTPSYTITLTLADKKFFTNGWWNLRKNNFYYSLNGYDIVITSSLNLFFKTTGENKQIQHFLKEFPENKRIKKQYIIETSYIFWNAYLTQIKFKDIISPTWTSKRNEF
jgi:hypothetical protein